MIKCADCRARIREPKRAWTVGPDGWASFYEAVGLKGYAKWLRDLAKRVPFVHEDCQRPDGPHIVALDLERRVRRSQWRTA